MQSPHRLTDNKWWRQGVPVRPLRPSDPGDGRLRFGYTGAMQLGGHHVSPASTKEWITNYLARQALKHDVLERALVAACRNAPVRRWLHVGAVALAYSRVGGEPEVRILDCDGYRMYVNLIEHTGICSFFFGQEQTAWPTRSLAGSGDVCVDAGANAGLYTLLFASMVGAQGHVVAFEPNPSYSALIEQSIALNGWQERVCVDTRALWRQGGEHLRFFLSTNPANSGTSSLINHGLYLDENRTINVETVTLDDYVREHTIKQMSVVKIDVERAETHVLGGMQGVLGARQVNYLIIEMLAHSDSHRTLAEQYGYKCFLIDGTHRELIETDRVSPGYFGDYLAVSPDVQTSFLRILGGKIR